MFEVPIRPYSAALGEHMGHAHLVEEQHHGSNGYEKKVEFVDEPAEGPIRNRGDVHIVPSQNGWRVEVEGSLPPRSTHRTQAEAAKAGRDVARINRSELLIHGRNGQVRARNTYGNDPPRPAR